LTETHANNAILKHQAAQFAVKPMVFALNAMIQMDGYQTSLEKFALVVPTRSQIKTSACVLTPFILIKQIHAYHVILIKIV